MMLLQTGVLAEALRFLSSLWGQALVGLVVGIIPGALFIVFLASPFVPGLWIFTEPVARVLVTLSQFIRGAGVLVKRASGHYEIGTYIPADASPDGEPRVQLSDTTLPVDGDALRWGQFGRKPFGLTWEPGTELHERAVPQDADGEPLADGGDAEPVVNVDAVHRYLRGVNEEGAISRTEEHAKAEYGGGPTRISDKVMAILIVFMMLLGTVTGYLMVG